MGCTNSSHNTLSPGLNNYRKLTVVTVMAKKYLNKGCMDDNHNRHQYPYNHTHTHTHTHTTPQRTRLCCVVGMHVCVRQFQFNKLFYGFLMVIDHIGRSKKLLFVLEYYSAYYPYTNCGANNGPLLIHLR